MTAAAVLVDVGVSDRAQFSVSVNVRSDVSLNVNT